MVTWSTGNLPGVLETTVSGLGELTGVTRELATTGGWGLTASEWGRPAFFANGIWYRGQRRWVAPQPALHYRQPEGGTGTYDEATLYSDFLHRLGGRPGMPSSDAALPWLVYMRHHDVPNRTLDWSLSALVATLFALIPQSGADPHLLVLNARALNEVTGNAAYLDAPLTAGQAPRKPWIWLGDSFEAQLRAEQAPARFVGHAERRLIAYHGTTRGFVGDDRIRDWAQAHRMAAGTPPADWLDQVIRTAPEPIRTMLWAAATPGATQPPWNNPRILAQKGVLTVHGGSMGRAQSTRGKPAQFPAAVTLDWIASNCADPGLLLRRIRFKDPDGLRDELRSLGLDHGDLLPETEHQVQQILRRHDDELER